MGQGRLNPSYFRKILLIAMAVQGLTPDLNDLASSKVLRLLCPYLVDNSAFDPEDDSGDDVCELVPRIQRQERFREADQLGLAGLAIVEGFREPAWIPIAEPGLEGRMVPRTRSLLDQLCRLAC